MTTLNLRKRWILSTSQACGAALLLVCAPAFASTNNLLINGDFNAGASGWTTWANGWANFEVPNKLNSAHGAYNPALVGVYDGTLQLTLGGFGGGWAGAFQTIAAAPGVTYTLTVQSGVEDWWKPIGEIRLIWLDAASAEISRDVVLTTCAINADCLPGTENLYDVGIPYANWTNIATAPVGTRFLKVEFSDPVGTGSIYFDNAYLTAPIDPPVIVDVYPNGLLQATNQFTFTAKSAAPIYGSNILLTLNGVDVSASLTFAGSGTTNVKASYAGLLTNRVYTGVINVTDSVNLSSFKDFTFDTFAPSFSWEAEDYDYTENGLPGQFLNIPVLSSTPMAGSYFGVFGTEGIDFHDRNGTGDHQYRAADQMATSTAGDIPRQNFVTAGVSDYNIGWFDGAGFPDGNNVGISAYQPQEWVNYTRTFVPGTYQLYGRLASGNYPTVTIPVARLVSGQGTTSQTTTPLGVFKFPANGWGNYAYVPLSDEFGNPITVSLTNTETLRVSGGSGANLNFFLLVPPDNRKPAITGVYPNGNTLLQGTNQLAFTASSPSNTIPQGNVVVTLNGVDVSSSLAFTGSGSSWNVTAPLALDVTNYTAVISVADDAGNSHAITIYFDTFAPASLTVEAEDWDFDSGAFIDNPLITSGPAANSFFDKVSTDGVDSFVGDTFPPPTADFRYRSLDSAATSVCYDTPTRALVAAQLTNELAFNYNVAWWSINAWLNYTRTYPAGNYNVYGRLAANNGTTTQIQLDQVSGAATNYLGTFIGGGRGYNAFDWIPLVNTNTGQRATVTLGGVATLRTTSMTGEVNPNSYLFVPAVTAPEPLHASYSAGVLTLSWSNPAFRLQAQTNAPGAGLSANWVDHPGGAASPVVVPVSPSVGSVFFRLSN